MAPPARKTKHKGNIRHQDQVGPGVYLVLVPDTYPLNLYNKVQLDNLYYLGSSYSPGDIIRQLFSPVEGNIIRELEYYASESLIG